LSGGKKGAVTRKIGQIEDRIAHLHDERVLPEPMAPETFFDMYVKPFQTQNQGYNPRESFARRVQENGVAYAVKNYADHIADEIYYDIWQRIMEPALEEADTWALKMAALRNALDRMLKVIDQEIERRHRNMDAYGLPATMVRIKELEGLVEKREGRWDGPGRIKRNMEHYWDAMCTWVRMEEE
jgi:hypothetical protein